MASLNDVLKEILEKDFEKEDVEKVVDSVESNDENKETGEETPEETGETYTGPGDFAQNSVGRGAVESFIKNSVYEKYGIDSKAMKSFARMTPTEMLSDFGKTVGELGKIRSDYQSGKMTAEGYKSAMSRAKGEIVGKMLEMGSSRKSILEDVFLRSVGIGSEGREIHSFKDIVDAFRQEEVDPVDKETIPDRVEIDHNETDINPDAETSPDIENPDVELAEADAEAETDKPDMEEQEQTQEKEAETDKPEERPETEDKPEIEDREELQPEEQELELTEINADTDTEVPDDAESESSEDTGPDEFQSSEGGEPQEETDEEYDDNEVGGNETTENDITADEPTDRLLNY